MKQLIKNKLTPQTLKKGMLMSFLYVSSNLISTQNLKAQNTSTSHRSNSDNIRGSWNTAIGVDAFNIDKAVGGDPTATAGNANTAVGYGSLRISNGDWNTAVGVNSLWWSVSSGYNCAFGVNSLYLNRDGNYNTASGVSTLYNNTSGSFNVATGYNSLYQNNSGSYNTANGVSALFNSQGLGNTGIGYNALYTLDGGDYNTAIGYNAGFSTNGSVVNTTSIGANAMATRSNTVVIGDRKITSIGGYTNWFNLSDSRFKKNIKEDVHGLDFIMELKPVSYNMDVKKLNNYLGANENKSAAQKESKMSKEDIAKENSKEEKAIAEKEAIRYSGFLAQEVEQTAKKIGYDFSGVIKPANDKDHYKMSYSDFVVPLVKAVQEQQQMIDDQTKTIKEQQDQINELKKMISNKENIKISAVELSNNSISLDQNIPNPFSNQTSISYSVPQNSGTAQILFYDATGRIIKTANITKKGKGQLNVFANDLTSGTYSYSLVIDGKTMNTKKLVKQ